MKETNKINYNVLKEEIKKLENCADPKPANTGNCQISNSYNLSKNRECKKFIKTYGLSMFSNNKNALNFIDKNKKEIKAKTKNCILIKS